MIEWTILCALGSLYLYARYRAKLAKYKEQDAIFAERLIQAAAIRCANNFLRDAGETKTKP